MLIYLLRKNIITDLHLPSVVQGNYWLSYKNDNGEDINLINIEANDDKWMAKSNSDASIYKDGVAFSTLSLELYNLYQITLAKESIYMLVLPSFDNSFIKCELANVNEITIGKNAGCSICYNNNLISDVHAKITIQNGQFILNNLDNQFGTYVNKVRIQQKQLSVGDTIFVMGLKIIFMGKFLAINNPNGLIRLSNTHFVAMREDNASQQDALEDSYLTLYGEEDYFEKSPRFITRFAKETVSLDSPPQKEQSKETPLLLTIGPMMSMGMISIVMAWTSLNGVINDNRPISTAIPSLVMAAAMLMSIMLWPSITRWYQKKQKGKKEQLRQEEYRKYLQVKNEEIEMLMKQERQVLDENNVSLEECQNIIVNRKRNLWEREIDQEDFLTVRLGIGTIKPDIDIKYPEEHFSLIQDNLKEVLESTVSKNKSIDNVPIKMSLTDKNITAIVGDRNLTDKFLESLLIQIMTFHSYSDLKIVFLTNKEENGFEYLKKSPHLFSDNKEMRFYGTNPDEIKQICNYLAEVYNSRKYVEEGKISDEDYKKYNSYYLVIVDDLKTVRNISVIKEIMESEINYGFTLLIRGSKLSNLPNECSLFITIGGENGKTSGYFENELTSDKQQAFVADLNVSGRVNMSHCIRYLANIPIKVGGGIKNLPKSYGFLEMYDVGNVHQLNVMNRWQTNNPTVSLQVPVGIDETGELFKLDLHEKAHGPHGLIAGMTGSGKSEFIITYILSMAVNYHPNEVSFVLIDYKGGGLTGAFENRETGVSLPHLAGTITNLDTVEMNRALASIQSELRRRQKIFNEARDKLGESTIDIYKYQRLYREGKTHEPVSHLFVISDEFAELKQQQPEFMDQLISTARIGRSLGVHLILATQKPSGVVNDQIWSNSKFRVCLKVQDKADSMDMIKCPDAASLKDVGRFYLQVGYNEYFALGQSAYCSLPYYPQEKRQKKVDTNIDFINNVGTIIKSVETEDGEQRLKAQGEEITNVLSYLVGIANENSIKVDKLWLNKIPALIYVDNLKQKYDFKAERNVINPIIGEFDDPNNQRQGLFTLSLTNGGNTIVYGTGDSGKEEFLTTMIYDTILEHSSSEVNFYILDFGSEFLKVFDKAPQVGDVVTSSEKEKVDNLFKLLNTLISDRKEILASYNGDFNLYNSSSDESLPLITIVINNYEAFAELYENENEELAAITRDSIKYGIVFVLAATGVSSVRLRVSQNFKQLIPLQLSDSYDYTTLLGKTGGLVPSSIVGRGLVKLDNIYEFQTAYAHDKETITEYLKDFCQKLSDNDSGYAPGIPILPSRVTLDLFDSQLDKLTNVPIGIYKDDLGVVRYNFKDKYVNLVSGLSTNGLSSFVSALVMEFALLDKVNVMAIDTAGIIKASNVSVYNSKFDEIIDKLCKYNDDLLAIYEKNDYNLSSLEKYNDIVCVISGVDSFFKRLKTETKTKFEKIISDGAEIHKVIFVLADTMGSIKTQEYSNWYKTGVNNTDGIWIGSGFYDQQLFKVNRPPVDSKGEISNNLGFVLDKSLARTVKFLEGDSNGK